MYGLYSKAACNQEQLMMARLREIKNCWSPKPIIPAPTRELMWSGRYRHVGNSANTDSICQAKRHTTPLPLKQTNKGLICWPHQDLYCLWMPPRNSLLYTYCRVHICELLVVICLHSHWIIWTSNIVDIKEFCNTNYNFP